MEAPGRKLLQLLVEHDPATPEFRERVRETLHPHAPVQPSGLELNLWSDVFVERPLPWGRFAQSVLLHGCAFALIWALSLAWLRQQKILVTPFDKSSILTYSPEEYLPPLDTGSVETPQPQTGDPAFAKQPILSVPREADNRSQTIVAPPDLKLDHDIPLPNIVATGAVAPIVPLNAAATLSNRTPSLDQQVVAPTPDVALDRNRITQAALRSDVVPPAPDVRRDRTPGMNGPEAAVVEPPPDLALPAKGRAGPINVAPSQVVAPAPELTLSEQHTLYGRGKGGGSNAVAGGAAPVAPAPSVAAGGAGGPQGRLIALNLHPAAPTGPVAVPQGNRRGAFSANPNGKQSASGTPESTGSGASGTGARGRNGSLPTGLHVGSASGPTAAIERNGAAGGNGTGDGTAQEMASLTSPHTPVSPAGRHAASNISDDKITEADRQVFGGRRPYGTMLNMPNLNSSTGSWVMHFAEMQEEDQKKGELLQPLPTLTSDPGYPLELIRANVHGTVTLYAVIHSDGRVGEIRVLSSADERLDSYAASALARWKFLPALKSGKPIPIEAVVMIPFRARKAF
ncbi:MAG TPA: energy transducer TonB [Terriglobales bacterium]|nr:energy transducer TonB [Terriglobales bacterium]